MATKSFLFGGSFGQPSGQTSLAFNFSRSFATVDPGGAALSSGTNNPALARYWHHLRLVCGAPSVTNYTDFDAFGSVHIVHSGGVGLDSVTPMLAYFAPDAGYVDIYEGGLDAAKRVHRSAIGHGEHQTESADPKRGWEDLFNGQPKGSGSSNTDDVADVLYFPNSIHICHGLVLAVCEFRKRQTDTSFSISSSGIVQVSTDVYDVTFATTSGSTPDIESSRYLYFASTPATARRILSVTPSGSTWVVRVKSSASMPTTSDTGVIPVWRAEGTALSYWQNVGSTPLWHRHWESSASQSGRLRGAAFQCQGFRMLSDQSPVTVIWCPFADYVNNQGPADIPHSSNGGSVFLMRATRSGVSTAWTLDSTVANPITLPSSSFSQFQGYHAHCAHVERYVNSSAGGAQGLRLVCPVGDAWSNNRVVTAYINNEANYATLSQWTVIDPAHGTTGDRHPPSSSGYLAVGEGNQYVGSAPYGWPGGQDGQVIGGDEMPVPLARAYAPTGAAASSQPLLEFTRLYGTGCASPNRNFFNLNYIFNCFYIRQQSLSVGGPFAAHFAPGSQDAAWHDTDEAGRLTFSPNGEHWGQCFAINHRSTLPVVFFGNEIVFGSERTPGRGVRSVSVPTTTIQRPLALGCGGKNLLRDVSAAVAVGTGNAADLITTSNPMPTGVPAPPCLGPKFRCKVPHNGTDQNLAIFKLTDDSMIAASSKVKVRFWVYPLTPTGTNAIAACWVANVALGMYSNDNGDAPAIAMAASREEFILGPLECVGDPVRGWYPVTLDTDPQAVITSSPLNTCWKTDGRANARPDVATVPPFPLGIRLLSRVPTRTNPSGGTFDGEPPNPTDFLIAFDYVIEGTSSQEHPGVPLPLVADPPVTLDGEQASISGFTCGTDWTIQVVGEVPDDAWDHTDTDRPNDKVLCTFWRSSPEKWISVIADPANHAIIFKSHTGASFSVTASSPEKFYFLRGSLIIIALKRSSSGLVAFVSVGGTQTVGPVTLTGVTDSVPSEIRFGDHDRANVQPMLWYGGRIDESTALSDSSILGSFKSLGMFYQKVVQMPPGPPPEEM